MKDILVPISPGELLDKITILRIKVARIQDAGKLANIRLELSLLEQTWQDSGAPAQEVALEERALQNVNERLWDIEDRIRDKEARDLRSRVHRAGARGVCLQRRARRAQAAHQPAARISPGRREVLPTLSLVAPANHPSLTRAER